MRPMDTRAWRKDGRRTARRDSEPSYWTPARMTRRQMGQQLVAETADVLARQAHIDGFDAAAADYLRWQHDAREAGLTDAETGHSLRERAVAELAREFGTDESEWF
jgi:hypothetical protein